MDYQKLHGHDHGHSHGHDHSHSEEKGHVENDDDSHHSHRHNHDHDDHHDKHDDGDGGGDDSKMLWSGLWLCLVFMAVELFAGVFAKSLAVITDALHMLTDALSFGLLIYTASIARLPSTKRYTFGFKRAEVLGALMSTLLIWILTAMLVYEAGYRMVAYSKGTMKDVDGRVMFLVAALGVAFNIVMERLLGGEGGHGHSHGGHGHGHAHAAAPLPPKNKKKKKKESKEVELAHRGYHSEHGDEECGEDCGPDHGHGDHRHASSLDHSHDHDHGHSAHENEHLTAGHPSAAAAAATYGSTAEGGYASSDDEGHHAAHPASRGAGIDAAYLHVIGE